MQQKTAIIIGAGPAGLTAAYTLLKETDLHPVILEESAFIGGISRTAVYRNNRMDIGGHRFFSKSDAVTALWNELMPVQGAPAKDDLLLGRQKPLVAGGPDPEKEDRVMLVRDRVSRVMGRLPDQADPPTVSKADSDSSPIMFRLPPPMAAFGPPAALRDPPATTAKLPLAEFSTPPGITLNSPVTRFE